VEIFTGVLVALIVAFVLWALRAAWARDRRPIEVHEASRSTEAPGVFGAPHDALPPGFVFQTRPIEPPPDPWAERDAYSTWAQRNGGVQTSRFPFRFTVRGTEEGKVRIDRVAVKVLNRRPPIEGIVYTPAAGGLSVDREVLADLDDIDSAGYARTERWFDEVSPDNIPQPRSWDLLEVSTTEVEIFVVVAVTNSFDCDFEIEIDYVGRYDSGTLIVNNNGRPFRVAAAVATDTEWILPGQ
jgi:hypothetical protein